MNKLQQITTKIINTNMIFNYNSVKISYEIFNRDKSMPIVFLHGWGSEGRVFESIIENFPEKTFITVDFPPFGKSDKDIKEWNIFTYVGMFMSLCDHLKIEQCDVIGHSFGGRIAIITSAVKRSLVHSCILVDSAGLKPKRKINYYVKLWNFKIAKKLGKDTTRFGSQDYLKLSPEMKRTFKSVVNTHLDDYAKKIMVKTLLIWGRNDKETPLYMCNRLKKYIKNSHVKIIDNAGHFPFLDRPLQFCKVLNEFLEDAWYS